MFKSLIKPTLQLQTYKTVQDLGIYRFYLNKSINAHIQYASYKSLHIVVRSSSMIVLRSYLHVL